MDDSLTPDRFYRDLTDTEARRRFLDVPPRVRKEVADGGYFSGLGVDRVSRDFRLWAQGYVECEQRAIAEAQHHRLPMAEPTDRYGRTVRDGSLGAVPR